MGRSIDLTKPLSEEDRAFLLARSRKGEVAVNDRQFGHLSEEDRAEVSDQHDADEKADADEQKLIEQQIEEEESGFDEDIELEVAPLKMTELRARLAKEGQPSDGDKGELQLRLLNFLQDQREAANG